MKPRVKNSPPFIIPLTLFALLLNVGGRVLADTLSLPVWLDSLGTFLLAYAAGPVCGAFVGFTNNLLYGIFVDQQSVYCIVGALLGVLVGCLSKKHVFDTEFSTMTLGMGLAIFSTAIAVIINTLLYEGKTGNLWGDQVMLFAMDLGLPRFLSYILGQFCVEFLDKLLTAEIVFLLVKMHRLLRAETHRMQHPSSAQTDTHAEDSSFTHVSAEKQHQSHSHRALLSCGLLLFLLTPALLPIRASAAESPYSRYIQTVYQRDAGLLPGEANDLAQTKDGRLFIGTYAGLYKYDGEKFTCLQDIPSVKAVNCLYVDEEGRLFVGTNDGGVTIFINEQPINVVDTSSGLPSNVVKSIVCDTDGNYYIGTSQGLAIVRLQSGVKVVTCFSDIKNVISLSADASGQVIAITERGELFLLKHGEAVPLPSALQQLPHIKVAQFLSDGRLLLGTTGSELYSYSAGRALSSYQLNGLESINAFYETENHDFFVLSDSGVATLSADGTLQKIDTGDFTSSIDHMLIDYQGDLWFSSSRLGLLELSPSPFDELFSHIGRSEVVNTTVHWQGRLLAGTDAGLLQLTDGALVEDELTSLLDGVRIRCLRVDRYDALWIAATERGVYRVGRNADGSYAIRQFTEADGLPGMRFRHLLELSNGRMAVAGDYGVAVLENTAPAGQAPAEGTGRTPATAATATSATGTVKHPADDAASSGSCMVAAFDARNGLSTEKSLCLLEYQDALYIGSDGGGITRIGLDGMMTRLTKAEGLSSDVILRMVEDPIEGGFFVVSSNGLSYITKDGEIRNLDRFPYSNNYDLVIRPDGSCWILSSAGIYIATVQNLLQNERTDYPLINTKRGFRDALVANAWMCQEGDTLYLCCGTGVVTVDMSTYDLSTTSYRMLMNTVMVDGKAMEIDRVDALALSAESRQITFAPEVLNYSLNDPFVRVQLHGYDPSPLVCRLSELLPLTYTNLKQGSYVFELSILDDLQDSVIESSKYTITKDGELYQHWWFKLYLYLIGALVLMWLTWFFTRTHIQQMLLKQKLELEYAKKQLQMSDETILSIAHAVDAKDSNTSQHSFRVSEYAVAIARRLGYSAERCEELRKIALLHDIGKIGIPDAILNKPGKLTDEEYAIMKTHVLRGGEILKDFTLIKNASVGALYHHERYDGKGYCHGLKREEIPLDARIIGIADAFDAMTANRVYRKQLDFDFVLAELRRCRGTQFDPKLTDILLSLIEDGEIDVESLYAASKGSSAAAAEAPVATKQPPADPSDATPSHEKEVHA